MKPKLIVTQQRLPKFVRRNRRLLAAFFAGLSVLTALNSLSQSATSNLTQTELIIPPGKTAISIEIEGELLSSALSAGQKIDLLSTFDGYASVVAQSAQVLRIGQPSSRLGGNAVEVLVAISLSEATRVATANQDGSLQVLLSPTD